MSKERECAEKLRAIIGKEPFGTYVAMVKSVDTDDAVCTVERIFDGMVIENVKLNASITQDEGIVITPKTDSFVLITTIDGLNWFVSQYSAVNGITIDSESPIVFNGGSNHGLVNIEELTQKLNAIEQDINTLKSIFSAWTPIAQDGGAVLKTGAQTWASQQLQITQQSDYEDTNITH